MALIIILEVSATVERLEGLLGGDRDEPDEGGRVIGDG